MIVKTKYPNTSIKHVLKYQTFFFNRLWNCCFDRYKDILYRTVLGSEEKIDIFTEH